MTKLVWTVALKTGDVEIDDQHKMLFGFVNDLVEAKDRDAVSSALVILYRYTRGHFTYEESVMRGLKVPKKMYLNHISQHNELISLLNKVSSNSNIGFVDTESVVLLVKEWCKKHIPVTDKALAEYINSPVGR